MSAWTPTTNAKYAVVVHDFTARNEHELTLPFGEGVHILEECGGWYRGCLTQNRSVKGIFPSSYVHLRDCNIDNPGVYETVLSKEDPVVQEVTAVLREWGTIWKKRYAERRMDVFHPVRQVMSDLLKYRRQICSGTLPQDRLTELKQVVTSKIDWGNWKLELDLVPRNSEGEIIDPDTTSIHDLYNVHVKSQKNVASAGHKSGTMIARKRESRTNHLYMDFKCIVCHIGDEADLNFSIYDPAKQCFLGEKYVIRIAKQGLVVDPTMLHATNVVFEDLSQQEISKDLYLVCQIIRVGRMLPEDKKGPNYYRRPYGVGVYHLKEIFQKPHNSTDSEDISMPILTVSNDSEFAKLHDIAISRAGRQTDKTLLVSLRMLHGDIEQLKRENPTIFGKTSSFSRRLGFGDVIMPGDVRNDLYVTLLDGEFERGSKKSQRNVEVSMKVVTRGGQVMPNCIFLGTGTKPVSEYRSVILRHNNHPWWNETVKVCLPFETFHECHLRFCFRHCSTRSEAKDDKTHFAFVRLQGGDGTTLKDDKHELFIYKTQLRLDIPDVYLSLPCGLTEAMFSVRPTSIAGVTRVERERFTISTLVCSTKLTQNASLLSLLKWRGQETELKEILIGLFQVKGDEIVRFLQDTFDALFAILDHSTAHEQYVFDALAYILELLTDPRSKYQHFQSVLNAYIQSHFSNTKAYEKLLACLSYYLENVSNPNAEFRQKLVRSVSAIEHIFKFVIKSRSLYARAYRNKNFVSFREHIDRTFRGICRLITCSVENLEAVQKTAFERFPLLYEDLLTQFDLSEVATFAREFIAAGTQAKQLKTPVARARNDCMLVTVRSKLFQSPESRAVLLPCILHSLSQQLQQQLQQLQRHELELACVEVLVEILTALQNSSYAISNQDVSMVIRNMFNLVLTIIRAIDKQAPPRHTGQFVVSLIAMLKLMKEEHYSELLVSFTERSRLQAFLVDLFGVFEDLIQSNVYSKNWMIMYMVQNNILVQAITYFTQSLCDTFLKGRLFEKQVWMAFFQLSVTFITQWPLQLENFSSAKQAKILDKYGDIRTVMAFQVLSMWQALEEHQVKVVPMLIGPFVSMTLVPQPDLRKATLPIFFDMMEAEMKANGNFKQVEDALFHHLDEQVSSGKGDEDYKELLSKELTKKCQDHHLLHESGIAFIESLTGLLERLLHYRAVGQSDEKIFKRTVCTVNLLNFYREIGRQQMYIRYIDKLCELHLEAGNFAEAGFTVLLHADMLEWNDTPLTPQGRHPAERERERKERLLNEAISHFNKGKVWEEGIQLCKRLAEQYETELFDYRRLSQILQTQAKFFDEITRGQRAEPIYCAVGFFGLGWPPFLRNKRYIFRGQELERLAAFNERLLFQCPQAQLMTSLNPPGDDILQSDGQYLQVCTVTPVPEIPDVFLQKNAKEEITHYYKFNEVKTFTFSRPFHRGKKDKDLEFKTLWLEKNTLKTNSKLPSTLRCVEIVSSEREELSPLKTAIEQMTSKLKELRTTLASYQADSPPSLNINPLSMLLKGMIDAAVMGGFSNYQKVFFVPAYLQENPGDVEMLNKLKQLIHEQVELLQVGLSLHAKRVPENLKPFHDNLETCYKDMRQNVSREIFGDIDSPSARRRLVTRSQTIAVRTNKEPVAPRGFTPSKRTSMIGTAPTERKAKESITGRESPIQSRPLPLPPKSSQTMASSTMPVPAPRSVRHPYEPVRSSSTGNLLLGDSQEDDGDERYMAVETWGTPTSKRVPENKQIGGSLSSSASEPHVSHPSVSALDTDQTDSPPRLPPKRTSMIGSGSGSHNASGTMSPPVPTRPRRQSQPDTAVHVVSTTGTGQPLPAPVMSKEGRQDSGSNEFQSNPFSLTRGQSGSFTSSPLSIARPRPRPNHFSSSQPPQTQQWPQQPSQPRMGYNPFAVSSVSKSNGQAVSESSLPSSLPSTPKQFEQTFSEFHHNDETSGTPLEDNPFYNSENVPKRSLTSSNPFVQADRNNRSPKKSSSS